MRLITTAAGPTFQISGSGFLIESGPPPVYSPALVAFIPLRTETIGWVPLGPGDPYALRYYDPNWSPRYLTRTQVVQERVINLNVPGAVTVVNVRDFNRVIDRRTIAQVDAQQFAHVRPVLDPFAVRNFRNVAMRTHEAERRFDVPVAAAQRIDRVVVTSTTPVTPFRSDLAQRFHVQPVPEKLRGERLQVRDNRQPGTAGLHSSQAAQPAPNQTNPNQANIAAEQARERQMADLSREAARGNRAARQQMQQLQRQQRQEQQQQREQMAAQQQAQRRAEQQAQGERVSNNVQTRRGIDQRQSQPPSAVQPPRENRGGRYLKEGATPPRANPQPAPMNQQPARQRRQESAPRPVQRQQPMQAQPRDRTLSPNSQPANRPQPSRPQPASRPQPSRPQPAPQPRPMREQRQAQPQPQRQTQPQPRSQPQPQVQRQPAQIRQQQPQQPQQQKNERQPAQPSATPAAAQPQDKKGREHP